MTYAHRNRSNRRSGCTSAAAAATGALAAGCGGAEPARQPVLKVFNWSDYIHDDGDRRVRDGARAAASSMTTTPATRSWKRAWRRAAGRTTWSFPPTGRCTRCWPRTCCSRSTSARLTNFGHLDPEFLDPPFDPGNRLQRAVFLGHGGGGRSHGPRARARDRVRSAVRSGAIAAGSRCSTTWRTSSRPCC